MRTYRELEAALQSVGNVTETARLKGLSLTAQERDFVLGVRAEAKEFGFTPNLASALEEDGAAIVRRAVRL